MTHSDAVRIAITGKWRTVEEVQMFIKSAYGIQISGSACSARIRELRTPKRGSHWIKSRHLHGNRWEYKRYKSGDQAFWGGNT